MLFVDILGYTLSSDAVCCNILSPTYESNDGFRDSGGQSVFYAINSNTVLNWEKGYIYITYHKFVKSSMDVSK